MKFTVQMKNPDTLHDAIREAVEIEVKALKLSEDESELVIKQRCKKVSDICSKWFRYGEYLEVEIDTEAKTCTVLNQ